MIFLTTTVAGVKARPVELDAAATDSGDSSLSGLIHHNEK